MKKVGEIAHGIGDLTFSAYCYHWYFNNSTKYADQAV